MFEPELEKVKKKIPPNPEKIFIAEQVWKVIVDKIEALEDYQKKLDNL